MTSDDLEEEEDVKKYRDRLPSATLDEQIEYLEEKIEIVQSQYSGYTLKRKEKSLRQQLYAIRRQLKQQRPRNSGSLWRADQPKYRTQPAITVDVKKTFTKSF